MEQIQPVLQALDFEVQPRRLMALVEPSSKGKTTITYLVSHLYDPTGGCVSLDGFNLRDIQLGSLSQYIGMVTQGTYLFPDSIRANLPYAKPSATQEELEEACTTLISTKLSQGFWTNMILLSEKEAIVCLEGRSSERQLQFSRIRAC